MVEAVLRLPSPSKQQPPELIPAVSRLAPIQRHIPSQELTRLGEETPEKRYPLPNPSTFTEYEKRYPPDRYGEELHPNARAFKIYRDRASEKEEFLVQSWHDTLNMLLVFAGLFSAVLSAFLIESSKQLKQDPVETTVKSILAVLILDGTNFTTPPSLSAQFTPTNGAKWINGLWFTSLALALVVSLLAILCKQWLVGYNSTMQSSAGDARRWAARHFVLSRGLSDWGVDAFISGLTVLLHGSLFLFLAGLSAYLRGLIWPVYLAILSLTSATGAFYVASILAPFVWPECPTRTSFHRQLEYFIPLLFTVVQILTLTILWAPFALLLLSMQMLVRLLNLDSSDFRDDAVGIFHEPYTWVRKWRPARLDVGLRSDENHRLVIAILNWIVDPDNQLPESDVAVAVHAIGAIDIALHRRLHCDDDPLRSEHVANAVERQYRLLVQASQTASPEYGAAIGRVLRAWIIIQRPVDYETRKYLSSLYSIRTHDVALLAAVLITTSDSEELHTVARDAAVRLAMWFIISPQKTAFHRTTLQLVSYESTRMVSPALTVVHKSTANAILVMASRCSLEIVDDALSRVDTGSTSYRCLVQSMQRHATGSLGPLSIRLAYVSVFAWAVANSDKLGITEDEVQTIGDGYMIMLSFAFDRRLIKFASVEAALMPFGVQSWSCTAPQIEMACNIFRIALEGRARLPSWSAQLGNIMCFLLKRRNTFGRARRYTDPWRLTHQLNGEQDHHQNVLNNLEQAWNVNHALQETMLNLLHPWLLSGQRHTSAWRLYLSMRDHNSQWDAESALMLVIELALLVRMGLEQNTAELLLYELAGDDRGIQLVLSSTLIFVPLANHAKMIDLNWWPRMKQSILNLSPERWDSRNSKHQHLQQQELVDEIEDATAPCSLCIITESTMRRILADRPPLRTTVTPIASGATVERGQGLLEPAHGTPLTPVGNCDSPIELIPEPGLDGATINATNSNPRQRAAWRRATTTIRAMVRFNSALRRKGSNMETQRLLDDEQSCSGR